MSIGELNYDPNNTEYMLVWSKNESSLDKEVCFHYGFNNASWYSSYEERLQRWPMDTGKVIRRGSSFTTVDFFTNSYFGSIIEHLFVNSDAFGIILNEYHPWFFRRDPNHGDPIWCVATANLPPYPNQTEYSNPNFFDTYIHFRVANNLTALFHRLHTTHIYPPKGLPDERMFRQPIWSTWAYLKRNINQAKILHFATDIVKHGFTNNSQLAIVDDWETHYGDLTFDAHKFPNATKMITELKKLGFRVTLWTTPYITRHSSAYASSRPHLVKDTHGHPISTRWNNAGIVDFSDSTAVKWWVDRLKHLQKTTGVDSFKFDYGEVGWYAGDFVAKDPKVREYTNWLSTRYVEACAQLGAMVEVQTAFKTQPVPVFTRMMDKVSAWGGNDGLKTLIPTALMMSLAGYSFIMPDIIGGNASPVKPSEELFIRWVQATTFMPAMQFSIPPWLYNEKTINITRKFVQLHAEHSDTIVALAKRRLTHSEPIIRPLWYAEPNDPQTYTIDDQFLLGSDILVAPVVVKGAVERSLYLPSGTWIDASGKAFTGPGVIKVLAPLEELPYFMRKM